MQSSVSWPFYLLVCALWEFILFNSSQCWLTMNVSLISRRFFSLSLSSFLLSGVVFFSSSLRSFLRSCVFAEAVDGDEKSFKSSEWPSVETNFWPCSSRWWWFWFVKMSVLSCDVRCVSWTIIVFQLLRVAPHLGRTKHGERLRMDGASKRADNFHLWC